MAAIYPTIQSSIEQVAKSYPAGLKEAFGVRAMNTVEGYVHAELFSLIVPLALGYYASGRSPHRSSAPKSAVISTRSSRSHSPGPSWWPARASSPRSAPPQS